MANKYTYQILRDTTTDSVIKLTGTFDGSAQELNGARIPANSLYGAIASNGYLVANNQGGASNTALSYYDLQITGVKAVVNFTTAGTGSVEMYWNGSGATNSAQYANSATIFHFNGNSDFGSVDQLPSILNNSGNTSYGAVGTAVYNSTVGNGDIGLATQGAVANSAYTLIVSIRKNNQMYQRGQFNDPAAFNFGGYSLRP